MFFLEQNYFNPVIKILLIQKIFSIMGLRQPNSDPIIFLFATFLTKSYSKNYYLKNTNFCS